MRKEIEQLKLLIATLAKPFICPGKEQRALGFHWIRQRGVLSNQLEQLLHHLKTRVAI